METPVCDKVSVIKSIAHTWFDLTGKIIDSDEFDFLYDQCIDDLAFYAAQLKFKLDLHNFITNLNKR
ncbi:hypothetical protein EB077_08410 [bacterium]|nr:hypothetical protein [bacterium]